MLLRSARTSSTARTAGRGPLRPPGARRAVLALVGAVVVGTGLGATGVGLPGASAEQASGEAVDLLAPSGATAGAGSLDARSAAEVSSRSAARDAAVDAQELQRAQEATDAARDGADAVRAAAQADVVARAATAQAAADAEAAAAQDAADAQAAAQQAAADAEAERQRVADAAAAAQAAASADPRAIGRTMTAERGWGDDQFSCLDSLWTKESGWTATADNPSSDAYGIPQSLPGSKMASAGADWATNPATQISWGLTYIRDVYGTPCSAWAHSRAVNWY